MTTNIYPWVSDTIKAKRYWRLVITFTDCFVICRIPGAAGEKTQQSARRFRFWAMSKYDFEWTLFAIFVTHPLGGAQSDEPLVANRFYFPRRLVQWRHRSVTLWLSAVETWLKLCHISETVSSSDIYYSQGVVEGSNMFGRVSFNAYHDQLVQRKYCRERLINIFTRLLLEAWLYTLLDRQSTVSTACSWKTCHN